jgi:hypothetical protein
MASDSQQSVKFPFCKHSVKLPLSAETQLELDVFETSSRRRKSVSVKLPPLLLKSSTSFWLQ